MQRDCEGSVVIGELMLYRLQATCSKMLKQEGEFDIFFQTTSLFADNSL